MTQFQTRPRFHQYKHSDQFHDYLTENVTSRAYKGQKVDDAQWMTDTAQSLRAKVSYRSDNRCTLNHVNNKYNLST